MMCANRAPQWTDEGADWPNRAASRFVGSGRLTWHVQIDGTGPVLLLLHGTAAASHSWRDVMPRLTDRFTVVVPDLPGHGFTQSPPGEGLSLPGMARSLAALLADLDLVPDMIAGHSAGAAIALRFALDATVRPVRIVSINGALKPFGGAAGHLFPLMARAMALNPLTPRLLSMSADAGRVNRMIRDTGSCIDAQGVELYRRLFAAPAHVACVLGMMARWDLQALLTDLPRLDVPLTLVTGDRDRAVPPQTAQDIQAIVPTAHHITWAGLGHLAHEEDPVRTADLLTGLGADEGLFTGD